MLKEFSSKNFRNVYVSEIKFKDLNLFVGPNNSGKSNFMEALSFFSDMLQIQKIDTSFRDMLREHGWDDVLNRDLLKPDSINMNWILNTNPDRYPDVCYELEFVVDDAYKIPNGFYITKEELKYHKPISDDHASPFSFISCHGKTMPGKGKFVVKNKETGTQNTVHLDVSQTETVFRQVENLLDDNKFRTDFYPLFKETLNSVKHYFDRFKMYSSSQFNLDKIKEPVAIDESTLFLKADGSNLVNVLDYLDAKHDFLDRYTQILRELMPGLQKVKVISTDRKRALQLIIDDEQYKLYEMSDGTIKAMILALLLWTPEKMSILALDEPELNMHPAWLKIIARWILRKQSANQVFISTHSPDLLDVFTESFIKEELALCVFRLPSRIKAKSEGQISSDAARVDAYSELFPGVNKLKDLKKNGMITVVSPEKISNFITDGWELGDLYRVGEPALGGWPW